MENQHPYNYNNEPELLNRLSKGDEYAYTHIYTYYHADILKLARKLAKSPKQAEELANDVFAKIWVNRQELPGVTSFNEYLFVTAHDYILSRLKEEETGTGSLHRD